MPQLIPRGDRVGVRIHLGHGKRKWLGTFDTEQEAWAAGLVAEEQLDAVADEETWSAFADRWLEDYNHVRKDGSLRWSVEHQRNLRYALDGFTEKWGAVPLSAFPKGEALSWVGKQPEYVLRAVRSMLNDARKDQLIDVNPFERLGLEKSKGRSEIVALTEEEVQLLAECALGACGSYGKTMHAFVLWQAYVGPRPLTTFNVRVPEFHASEGTVYLRGPGLKRHAPRTVIVPPAACAVVARLPISLDQKWLFVSPRGHQLTSSSLSHHWNKFRGIFDSKLDPRRAQELRDARPSGGSVEPYELRHFCATDMWERGLEQGRDVVDDIAWQLANSAEKIRELYGHPTDSGRRQRLHGLYGTQTGTQELEVREARA